MADLIKNDRFKAGDRGVILYNPYFYENTYASSTITNQTASKTSWLSINAGDPIGGGSISSWDILLYGGQVGGFALFDDTETYISVPYGSYDNIASTDISGMLNQHDTLYAFKEYNRCYSVWNGSEYENKWASYRADTGTGGELVTYGSNVEHTNNNVIENVYVISNEIVKNHSTFGHHSNVYQTYNTYKLKLLIPYSTTITQIEQMIESRALAFYADDIDVYTFETATGYSIVKPLGGGSVSPLIRKITLLNGSLTESNRRNGFEIEVIIEG